MNSSLGTTETTSGRWESSWPLALVLLVGAMILLPRLGEFGLWDPWEPKYVQSAKEMEARHSWVVPYYRDEPRLTKPILVYWGVLTGTSALGHGEWGARIVGALLAIASVGGVYYAVTLLRGRRAGLLAALVLATMPQFYLLSRQAMPDVYLLTSIGTAVVFLALGLFGPATRRDLHLGVSYACFGLAILAKGPVIAAGVYLLPLALFAVLQLDVASLWKPGVRGRSIGLLAALVLSAAVALVCVAGAHVLLSPPKWWSFDDGQREAIGHWRESFLADGGTATLASAILGLVVLLGGLAAFALWRVRERPAVRQAAIIACGGITAMALAGFLTREVVTRLSLGAVLLFVLAVLMSIPLVRELASLPGIHGAWQASSRPVARQLLRFLIIVGAVAGPWHLLIVASQGDAYYTDFILKHNVYRAQEIVNRTGSIFFYVPKLLFGAFPWSAFVPSALVLYFVGLWRGWVARFGVETYLLLTTALSFAALSAAATKFPHYLAPLLMPLAVFIGLTLDRMLEWRGTRASTFAWAGAALLCLSLVVVLSRGETLRPIVASVAVKDTIPPVMQPGIVYTVLLAGIALLFVAQAALRRRPVVVALVVIVVGFATWMNTSYMPRLSAHKTMGGLTRSYYELRDGNQHLGYYGDLKHGLFYYVRPKDYLRIRSDDAAAAHLSWPGRNFLLLHDRRMRDAAKRFAELYPDRTLFAVDTSHFSYVLVSNAPVGEAIPFDTYLRGQDELTEEPD